MYHRYYDPPRPKVVRFRSEPSEIPSQHPPASFPQHPRELSVPSPPDTIKPKMSSWLERQFSSHQVQLAGAALLSGATVAGLIYGAQAVQRKSAVEELKASIPELDERRTHKVIFSDCFNQDGEGGIF